MYKLINIISEYYWRVRYEIARIGCFLVGHVVNYGSRQDYEPDWCDRCGLEYPQDDLRTLPCALNVFYGWLVEREWAWFDKVDRWFIEKLGSRLPEWWSY